MDKEIKCKYIRRLHIFLISIILIAIFMPLDAVLAGEIVPDGSTVSLWQFNGLGGKELAPGDPDLSSGVKGLYHFNGDATASNAGGPTLTGGATPGNNGKFDRDFYFNGFTYLQAPNSSYFNITGALTISVWIKPGSISGRRYIVSKYDYATGQRGFTFGFDTAYCGTGQLSLTISEYTSPFRGVVKCSNATVPLNVWSHVAVVFNPGLGGTSRMRFFINGNYVSGYHALNMPYCPGSAGACEPGSIAANNKNFRVGAGYDSTDKFYGYMDELVILNTALSDQQITSHYSRRIIADTATNNNGTISGSVQISPGRYGNAQNFDGINDYISTNAPSIPSGSKTFSMSAWIKPADLTGNKVIYAQHNQNAPYGDGIAFMLYGAKLGIHLSNSGSWTSYASPLDILTPGIWQHIVYSSDAGVLKIYVNGDEKWSTPVADWNSTGATQSIGAFINLPNNGNIWFFSGQMDEIGIFNRSLSADEISSFADKYLFFPTSAGYSKGDGVDKNEGTLADIYTYKGVYKNKKGIAPDSPVQVCIDSSCYDMLSVSTTDYITGVTYSYSTTFTAEGILHSYYFMVTVGGAISYLPGHLTQINNTGPYIIISPGEISSLTPGLTALWHLNETSMNKAPGGTDVYDIAGNGNHGIAAISMTDSNWVPGRYGKSLDFDGVDDYVKIASSLSGLSFSVEAWVKKRDVNDVDDIIVSGGGNEGGGNYWEIGQQSSLGTNNLVFGAFSSGGGWVYADSGVQIVDTRWHHVAGTYSSGVGAIYIDGELKGVQTNVPIPADTNTYIGRIPNNVNFNFNGLIDETAIYNRALSAAEIAQHSQPYFNYSLEAGFSDGVEQNVGLNTDTYTYKAVYTDPADIAPSVSVLINGIPYFMTGDPSLTPGVPLRDGDYTNGEQFAYTTAAGFFPSLTANSFSFSALATGRTPLPLPSSGVSGGPWITDGQDTAPVLSYSQDTGFTDGVDPGSIDCGNSTNAVTFKVVYADANNEPPQYVNLVVDNATTYPMTVERWLNRPLYYADGAQYSVSINAGVLGNGIHSYRFETKDSLPGVKDVAFLPSSGNLAGPAITILQTVSSSQTISVNTTYGGCLTVTGNNTTLTLKNEIVLTVSGQLNIINNAKIAIDLAAGQLYDNNPHYITINAGNLNLNSGSAITGNGLGYRGGVSDNSGNLILTPFLPAEGPGRGTDGWWVQMSTGAGYGGVGQGTPWSNYIVSGGISYGDIKTPLYMGSGGGATDFTTRTGSAGGAGGGAVKINVSGKFTLNGVVKMNGADGKNYFPVGGGGSGGSIYVISDTIEGTGQFQSDGGKGGQQSTRYRPGVGGAGAGGRIAVYATSVDISFDIYRSHAHGWGGDCGPGEGSVYLNNTGVEYFIGGTITYPQDTVWAKPDMEILCGSNYTFNGSLTVNGTLFVKEKSKLTVKGALTVGNQIIVTDKDRYGNRSGSLYGPSYLYAQNNVAVFGQSGLLVEGPSTSNRGTSLFNMSGSLLSAKKVNIWSGATLAMRGNNTLSVPNGSVDITGNSQVIIDPSDVRTTLDTGYPDGTGMYYDKNFVTIETGQLNLENGSKIDGYGTGYRGGVSDNSGDLILTPFLPAEGPGRGTDGWWVQMSTGAGYGGVGQGTPWSNYIVSGGISYGDIKTPLYMGSGGGATDFTTRTGSAGGAGGGAVKINVSGKFTLNGVVKMNGADGKNYFPVGGGGSGGSIYVISDTIEGTGQFQSDGGKGGQQSTRYRPGVGGAGAGGRIAVYANTLQGGLNYINNNVSVHPGGVAGVGISRCAAGEGTIYFDWQEQGAGNRSTFVFGQGTNNFTSLQSYYNLTIKCLGKYIFHENLTVDNDLILDDRISSIFSKSLTIGRDIALTNSITMTVRNNLNVGRDVNASGDVAITADRNITVGRDMKMANRTTVAIGSLFSNYNTLDVIGILDIDPSSLVHTNGKGFAKATGLGEGFSSLTGGGGGASFAGLGNSGVGANAGTRGLLYGQPIYSVSDLMRGSRGGDGANSATGGEGGGALYLKTDTLVVDGTISANGLVGSIDTANTYSGGGGAGGSIYIDAGDIFTSGGMVSAIEGRSFPAPNRGGSGGGGRIAVRAGRSTNNFIETNLKCSNGECYVIPVISSLSVTPQASRNSIVTLQLTGTGMMNNSRLSFFDAPGGGSNVSNHILYVNINQAGSSVYTADIYIKLTMPVDTVYAQLTSPNGGKSQEIHSFSVLSGSLGLPPVSNLAAQTVSSSKIDLTWTPSINTGVLGYYVRYSTSPITSLNWSSAAPVINNLGRQVTGITVTGLSPSTGYYLGVVAYDANTPATDSVIAATSSATVTNPDTPPGQVANLSAQTISSNFVELTWTAPGEDSTDPPGTKASSYDLRQEMGITIAWATAIPLATPAPSVQGTIELFTINGLLNSTNYCFAITSQDQNANISPVSNTLCITTAPAGDITSPSDITDLSVLDSTWNKNTNGAEVTVSWSSVGDDGMNGIATSYELYIAKKVIRESTLGDLSYNSTREIDIDTVSVIPLTSGSTSYPCGQKSFSLPKPAASGTSQCYTLFLYDKDNNGQVDQSETLDSNTAYYLVMHTIDDGGNYSRSNLLKVRTALIQTAQTGAWQDIFAKPPSETQTAAGGTFTVTNTWQWNMISTAKRPMGSFFGFPIPVTVGNLFYPAIINNSQLSVWKWNSTVTGIIDPVTETFTGNWTSPLQNNAQTGDGYYVLAPQAYHVINENAVPGSDETNASVTIPLVKGWNIIGNPYRYLYNTSGQTITDRSGNAYEGSVQLDGVIATALGVTVIYSGIEYDFNLAANMQNAGGVNIIGNTIYTWNGYGWEAKGYDNSFNDGALLAPWKGYWILANDDNLQLKIYKPVK